MVAFFASRTAPPEALDLAKRWGLEVEWNAVLESYMSTGLLVLLTNDNGEYYYDDQVIEVPKGMCMRQVGIYKYQTRMEIDKTVPIVKLMSK